MDYLGLGEKIDYSKYNALVYLLRKFKRLHSQLKLGNQSIIDDFGTYNFIGGLESIGGNWILESDVNIVSQDVLPNTEYAFSFTVVDVNTTGVVNKRVITFTGVTGETGELNITIPVDSISSDEQILSDFTVDIIFDEHEYYTPITNIHVDLISSTSIISAGESATVTATITDDNGNPISDFTVEFKVNNEIFSETTDNEGIAILTINGTGGKGLLKIRVIDKEINIIDAYYVDYGGEQLHNPNWWNQGGLWFVEYNQEVTRINCISYNQGNYGPSVVPSTDPSNSNLLEFNTPYCIEFDARMDWTYLRLWDGDTTEHNIYFQELITEKWDYYHYKLIVTSTNVQLWINDTLIEKEVNISDDTAFSFVSLKSNYPTVVDYKNFTVYKI